MSIFFGNVPLVFVWLALAHNVHTRRNMLACSGNHVLGLVEWQHGLLGRSVYQWNGNTIRGHNRVLHQRQSHRPTAFLRRLKISRPMFDDLVEKIKPIIYEPNEFGIKRARRSSGSHVPAEVELAASLRGLSGATYSCQQDNFGLGGSAFVKSL